MPIPPGTMSNADRYDLIIVGAGPAGISTALHLAQMAPEMVSRTLILEKARHPRPKLCGGGLLPDAEVVLHSLGLDSGEVPHCDVDWAHFDYDGKGMRMRGEKGGGFAFRTIRRHEFDAWLVGKVRACGFIIHENTSVKRISVNRSEVLLETDQVEYRATVVVGADGSKSVIRRLVVPHESTHTARLLEIVTEPRPEKSFHIQANSYFDFLYVPQGILGYTWDFPALENGRPVRVRGIYDSNVYPAKKDISLRLALADEFERHGYRLDDYELEGIRCACSRRKAPFRPLTSCWWGMQPAQTPSSAKGSALLSAMAGWPPRPFKRLSPDRISASGITGALSCAPNLARP